MAYQAAKMLIGANDVVMCREFFSTLRGIAHRWLLELQGEFINTFYDMVMKFTTHFMREKKANKHFSYLAIVKQ